MVGDTDLLTMQHLQEMAPGVYNGHMPDDVTWPWKVKVVTVICLGLLSWEWLEIDTLLQWSTY